MASKFLPTDITQSPPTNLKYILSNMDFYPSNIQTKYPTDGNYHISYDKPNNQSSSNYNVKYENKDISSTDYYITTDFYFYKLFHNNITGVTDETDSTIIGEFIVKNINVGNGTPLYLCFLLKQSSRTSTTDSSSFSVLFNNIISNGKNGINYADNNSQMSVSISPSTDGSMPPSDDNNCIIYIDHDGQRDAVIVVYMKPIIIVNPGLINFLGSLNRNTTPPFKKYPTKGNSAMLTSLTAQTSPQNKISSSDATKMIGNAISSGTGTFTDGEIYIDCNPTGESLEEIPSYSVPIGSNIVNDIQTSTFQQLCSNYVGFIIMIVVTYVAIIRIYYWKIDVLSDTDKISAKYIATFYLLIIGAFVFAIQQNMYFGFLLFFLAFLTNVIISNEEMKNGVKGEFKINEVLNLLGKILKHITNKNVVVVMILLWCVLISILSVLYFAVKKITLNEFKDSALWVGTTTVPIIAGLSISNSGQVSPAS